MQRYPFIFSDERKYRFQRHFLFWFCWWAFQSFLYSFSSLASQVPYFQRLPLSAIESSFYLVTHMFLSYSLLYWVIPRLLLRGKYIMTLISVVMLILAAGALASIIGVYILQEVRSMLLGKIYIPPPHIQDIQIFNGLLAGLRGSISIAGMAAAIKLMKYWYMKEQRNMQLQSENVAAQLQILKAQVHPHFLFNTLNNIYSYTQNTSPVASKLVMGLSDMLRYMTYECNQPTVPLAKELKMLKDYIMLEHIRYNRELDISIDIPSDTKDLFIAPLLLLPFMENSFKHGASQLLEHPWVHLGIHIDNNVFQLKLANGKAPGYVSPKQGGIGISNVRKRLEILYPGKFTLKIVDEEDVFVVNLKLELEKKTGVVTRPYQMATSE